MLDALKNWFGKEPAARKGWDSLAPWADSRQYAFRGVRKSDGFVIEGMLGASPWRLEWGPSQRPYVSGFELRMRCELGLPGDLQVLVLNRELQESMEAAVFDRYVEGVQTRIDTNTPPEMRWLVMFPKLADSELKGLRERYAVVSSQKHWAMNWLDGTLCTALASAPLAAEDPVVLMIGRGRLMLRTSLPEPEIDVLDRWIALFGSAIHAARRATAEGSRATSPSTQPSLWNASAMPGEEPKRQ